MKKIILFVSIFFTSNLHAVELQAKNFDKGNYTISAQVLGHSHVGNFGLAAGYFLNEKDKIEIGAGAGIQGAPISLIYRRYLGSKGHWEPFASSGLVTHFFESGNTVTSIHVGGGVSYAMGSWFLQSSLGINIPTDFSSDDNLLSLEVLSIGRVF